MNMLRLCAALKFSNLKLKAECVFLRLSFRLMERRNIALERRILVLQRGERPMQGLAKVPRLVCDWRDESFAAVLRFCIWCVQW